VTVSNVARIIPSAVVRQAVITAAVAVLAGCGTGPDACTLNIEPAVTVRALEAGTGQNVTDGAQGTITDGAYSDSLVPDQIDATQHVLRLRAADERPGSYDLFVERPGYQAVALSNIRVTRGDCHVNTVDVDVTFVPIPQH
jgi:hypothetical protein